MEIKTKMKIRMKVEMNMKETEIGNYMLITKRN